MWRALGCLGAVVVLAISVPGQVNAQPGATVGDGSSDDGDETETADPFGPRTDSADEAASSNDGEGDEGDDSGAGGEPRDEPRDDNASDGPDRSEPTRDGLPDVFPPNGDNGDDDGGDGPTAVSARLPSDPEIDDAVARALFERARTLYEEGNYAHAEMLLNEALARSPNGSAAAEVGALLAAVAAKLRPVDETLPSDLLDPYSTGTNAPAEAASELYDPYGADSVYTDLVEDDGVDVAVEVSGDEDDWRRGRQIAIGYGGLFGFAAGTALGSSGDDVSIGLGIVGAGLGLGGTYLYTLRRPITTNEAAIISSSGLWFAGAVSAAVDLSNIDGNTAEEVLIGTALGGLAGTGAGWLASKRLTEVSEGDIAITNSMGLYGMTSALLVGIAIQPVESEGYTLNGVVGAAAGLGLGIYSAGRLDVSRTRMLWVDLGALAGAGLPWLVYPFVYDEDSRNEELTLAVLSTVGLFAGAYMAWRWSTGIDASLTDKSLAMRRRPRATVPGLIRRDVAGGWTLGLPGMRRPGYRKLADNEGVRGLAIDVVSGHF